MKRSLSVMTALILAIGATRIVGCGSTKEPPSQESVDGFAGGNGAFGESPVQPGAYADDAARNPSQQAAAQSAASNR